MDAINRDIQIGISISGDNVTVKGWFKTYYSDRFDTFSDFTQAVKEYIKSLEG